MLLRMNHVLACEHGDMLRKNTCRHINLVVAAERCSGCTLNGYNADSWIYFVFDRPPPRPTVMARQKTEIRNVIFVAGSLASEVFGRDRDGETKLENTNGVELTEIPTYPSHNARH